MVVLLWLALGALIVPRHTESEVAKIPPSVGEDALIFLDSNDSKG